MTTLTTTFALLREHRACPEGYKKLATALGGVRRYGATRPIPLLAVLEHNGLLDALWCLRATPPEQGSARDRLFRLFTCDFVERELPIYERAYPGDSRVRDCIAVARRFAMGQATEGERSAARAAAAAAANAAASDAVERQGQAEHFRKLLSEQGATP